MGLFGFGKRSKGNVGSAQDQGKTAGSAQDQARQAGAEQGSQAGADLKQDLSEEAQFQRLYQMHLLFEGKPEKPSAKTINDALEQKFGEVDMVSGDAMLTAFAVKKYEVKYEEGNLPAQVMMVEAVEFEQDKISPFERTQFWDLPDGEELLQRCSHSLLISDFMASMLDYKERCELLTGWLEVALCLFPDCVAVWIPASGKLLTAEQIRNNPQQGEGRFLHFGVNARFFKIEGTEDMLVDTLGLYAVGLPDVQYHFHGMDPNAVVNHAYNVASYLFGNDAPIKSGETIDGLDENGKMKQGVQWKCQYETALIQPVRELMDICPGDYAAGNRDEN